MTKGLTLFIVGTLGGVLGAYLSMSSPERAGGSFSEAGPGAETTVRSTPDSLPTRSNGENGATEIAGSEPSDLQVRVEDDAFSALLEAAAIRDRPERRRAVMLIGRLWAGIDPEAALIGASALPTELVADYNASVASEWANLDAQSFLNFAERTSEIQALVEGLDVLIATDPARVYELASRLTSVTDISVATQMHPVQRAALHALADRDPAEAMRLIAPLLPKIDMTIVAQEVVTRFARSDPDAALAWLDSFDGATDTHRRVVFEGVAQVDFARAFEFASTMPGVYSGIDSALARAALSDTARVTEVASMLLNQDSQLASRVLEQLLGTWAFREPDRLVDWMLANAGALDASLARSVASRFAASDLDLAMSLLDRVPPQLSSVWVSEVAAAYASREPAAALDWIRQYQGQAFYDDLHSRVIMGMVDADPKLAATLINEFAPALRSAAAPGIAWSLTERDPVAAAQWASRLEDPAVASSAVFRVANAWIQRDVRSATNWAMGLDRGALRDQALYGLIAGSYGTNLDPRPVLDEIDSDDTRKMAQQAAIGNNSSSRPALARELAEEMIDDPLYGEFARDVLTWLGESGN